MKKSRVLSAWLGVALLTGCGSSSGGGSSEPEAEKETPTEYVAPISGGTWYQPDVNTTWQWQLVGTVNTAYDVEVYDIDLFDTDASLIESLHSEGKRVICYFSAGSWEDFREDAADFPVAVLGKELDGWPDEKWLDISNDALKPIMQARLDLAVAKGCDGVEPDNVDGYTNDTGFSLSGAEQLAYNRFIANEAHERGLAVGLKNDLDQVMELEPYYDFSVNEQCHEYEECDTLVPFIAAGKPVWNAEYLQVYVNDTGGARESMCGDTLSLQFQTLVLPLNLDDTFRYSCTP